MLSSSPSLYRLPPPSSSHLFFTSFSSAISGKHRLNIYSGFWRQVLKPRNVDVLCMANQRRVKMVAKQIRRELSDMLLTDKVVKFAVLPEVSLGADRYLSSLTTISDVVVSGDLQVVKVYVSVFGDERGKEVAISGLKAKTKYVRSELGRRMKLRLTPEIRFIPDDSIERGSRVIAILDKLKDERENSGKKDEEELKSSELSELHEDWNKDDPDGDEDTRPLARERERFSMARERLIYFFVAGQNLPLRWGIASLLRGRGQNLPSSLLGRMAWERRTLCGIGRGQHIPSLLMGRMEFVTIELHCWEVALTVANKVAKMKEV